MSVEQVLSGGARLSVIAAALVLLGASPQAFGQPSVAFLSPSSAAVGDPAFTVSVVGSNFVPGSTVLWNGAAVPTVYGSANQLTASIASSLLPAPGSIGVFVRAPNGSVSNSASFTIQPPPIFISTATLPAATSGIAYSTVLTATGGLPPYTWTATGALPPALSLATTGGLSGVPTVNGTFSIQVRVTDALQRSAVRALTLTINSPPLTISTSQNLPKATAGNEYSITLQAENGAPPLRWQLGPGAPAGLTLNSTTGALYGVPSTRGTYTFQVQATDAAGAGATKTVTLAVQPPELMIATLSPLFHATAGSPYSQTFSASGGTPPYRWSMTPSVNGLVLDANSGALTGTPSSAAAHSISVQVQDSEGGTAGKTFSLVIDSPRLTIVTASSLPNGAVGLPYSVNITAAGGSEPYSWSIGSGQVPGLSIAPGTGVLSGTPTAGGSFSFTLQARDSAGRGATRPFTITVAPAALQIVSDTEVWTGTVLAPFAGALSATGGISPYTWSANGLPQGLSVNAVTGHILGTPASPGTFPFTVRVADANRASATRLFQIVVTVPDLPFIWAPDVPHVSGPAEQHPVQVQLESPYSLPLSGQLLLSFSPDAGAGDSTIQFSSGGRMAEFTIPEGSTVAEFQAGELGIQTGTVSGTILLAARFTSNGADIMPTPVAVHSIRVDRAAPVITHATFSRTGGAIRLQVTGYCTSREVTQAVVRFSSSMGNSIANPEVTIPVEELFIQRFTDPASAEFGSQFTWTQEFTVQGDVTSVTPIAVTLTNRAGAVTADVRP